MKLYVYLCPHCEREQLPAGSYRTRCKNCNTYYSIDDERPEEKERKGWWWERNERNYPKPSIERAVVLADPSVAPLVEASDFAEMQTAYDADEAIARAWVRHLVDRWGIDAPRVRGWPRPRRRFEPTDGTYRTAASLPVPYVVGANWREFGHGFTICEEDRLCQVCGEPLGSVLVLCRGHLKRRTSGPPCHPRCAALAVQFCPHLIELDEDDPGIPIAYRYEGDDDGIGYDRKTVGEPAVYASARPLTRTQVRDLAKTDPLGRGGAAA